MTFSDPTGDSSFVTTEETRLTDASSTKSQSIFNSSAAPAVKGHHRRTSSDRTQSSDSSSSTSRDHPALHRLDMKRDDLKRQQESDIAWQKAVNIFLQNDPIAKTPRMKTVSSSFAL